MASDGIKYYEDYILRKEGRSKVWVTCAFFEKSLFGFHELKGVAFIQFNA